MGDVHDFDAFTASDEGTGPTVRVAGQEWVLPADAPARGVARIQRLRIDVGRLLADGQLTDDDDVPDELVEVLAELESPVTILRLLIGDEMVDAMLDAGMGSLASTRLSQTALRYYETGVWEPGNPTAPKGAKQPQDRKPKKAAKRSAGRTSSSTGPSSKPTSNASTG